MGDTYRINTFRLVSDLASTVYVVAEVNMLVHIDANASMEGKNELNKHSQNN